MTPAQARRELPSLSVVMPDGKTYTARVSGRMNPYPTVSIHFVGQRHAKRLHHFRSDGIPWYDFVSTWEQVATHATSGEPIVWA